MKRHMTWTAASPHLGDYVVGVNEDDSVDDDDSDGIYDDDGDDGNGDGIYDNDNDDDGDGDGDDDDDGDGDEVSITLVLPTRWIGRGWESRRWSHWKLAALVRGFNWSNLVNWSNWSKLVRGFNWSKLTRGLSSMEYCRMRSHPRSTSQMIPLCIRV